MSCEESTVPINTSNFLANIQSMSRERNDVKALLWYQGLAAILFESFYLFASDSIERRILI